ncbi:MAG: hypothetical protein ACI8XB_001360 [Patiriisocius sp.]
MSLKDKIKIMVDLYYTILPEIMSITTKLTHQIVLPLLIAFLVSTPTDIFPWGQTGHRAIGKIAENHLTPITRANLERLMGYESLGQSGTWMDEVRSDSTYNFMKDWHWVTIPDSCTYEACDKNPHGDAIATIERIISELETRRDLSLSEEHNYIRILCHLVADIHQPLHVGNGTDRGGNDVKVTWFWDEETNLHRVWDSHMIDQKKLSFTELAEFADHSTFRQRQDWQNQGVRVWARESKALRDEIYDLPEDKMLSYKYLYRHWPTVKDRLMLAGIRLAGILNKIYG